MKGPTHIAGGAVAGLGVSAVAGFGPVAAAAFTAGAVATSKLPDIDVQWSRGPKHRRYPHSLAYAGTAVLLVSAVVYALLLYFLPRMGIEDAGSLGGLARGSITASDVALVAPGATTGYFSHLALDSTTKIGIWLTHPEGTRVGIPERYAINTSRTVAPELAARVLLCGAAVGLALLVFGGQLADLAEAEAVRTGSVALLLAIGAAKVCRPYGYETQRRER